MFIHLILSSLTQVPQPVAVRHRLLQFYPAFIAHFRLHRGISTARTQEEITMHSRVEITSVFGKDLVFFSF